VQKVKETKRLAGASAIATAPALKHMKDLIKLVIVVAVLYFGYNYFVSGEVPSVSQGINDVKQVVEDAIPQSGSGKWEGGINIPADQANAPTTPRNAVQCVVVDDIDLGWRICKDPVSGNVLQFIKKLKSVASMVVNPENEYAPHPSLIPDDICDGICEPFDEAPAQPEPAQIDKQPVRTRNSPLPPPRPPARPTATVIAPLDANGNPIGSQAIAPDSSGLTVIDNTTGEILTQSAPATAAP
jgi:hypothetical protein